MKKIVVVLLLCSLPLFAQSAGESGLSFLKMGFGARNIALADNGAVLANDVTSVFYNPAMLANNYDTEIMIMHNEWIQDVQSEVLGAKFSLFGIPLALGINSTRVGEIEMRTQPGEAEGIIEANYFFTTLATGFSLSENLDAGFAIKYVYEGILNDEATGWSFDFGASYALSENLWISASLRNLGSMNDLRNESTELPTEIRIGPGYKFCLPDQKFSFVVGAEFQKYSASDDSHINFAGEIIYDEMLALRLGYQTMYDSKSITGGLGIKWGRLNFDYAVTPFSFDLGTGHTVSVKFRF